MFDKLYRSNEATVVAFAGYPLFFFIYEFVKYYRMGAGGGDVIAFIMLFFVVPYCFIVALLSFIIFIFQHFVLKKSNKPNNKPILNKTFFLIGFFTYLIVSFILFYFIIYSLLFC